MPALNVTPAHRAALRSDAHALKPVVLIGAEGLSEAVIKEIRVHLDAHELIKIRVSGDDREARVEIYDAICDRLDAAPIQHIGKLLVVWRPAPEETPLKPSQRASSRLPSVNSARGEQLAARGGAPRVVKVTKPSSSVRKPKPVKVTVRGNERVTAGGNVKRAKPRQTSAKRHHQSVK
ncbi:YhbY family RNA-binding protein [Pararobbsia silviterrae]|uniref:YhbY family RNA-binding protein n=1 Tax=Pararobbsia silviterrae TaxID=1792498 RepID=A0A494Y0W8_9BURK|nr:YhbY family RNA-binding protein [Pararobbsia silviterrae]RKP56417.1 YhbY family RNA-binding protein [Pararobbsia silviterrae]